MMFLMHSILLKCPLSAENYGVMSELFERATQYILGFQIRESKGEPLSSLCSSRSKTDFQGYIVSMKSIMAMFQKFVVEKKLLDSIPTMTISQDYLEITFGRIRSLNGECDNPTPHMYQSAYRKILANTTVLYSRSGNCKIKDKLQFTFSRHVYLQSIFQHFDRIVSKTRIIDNIQQIF